MNEQIKKTLIGPLKTSLSLIGQRKYFDVWDNERSFHNLFNIKRNLLFSKVHPYTMVTYKRLANLYLLANIIENSRLKGCFVECGVWKGGCSAILAYVANKARSGRKICLFDSFEGLPEPKSIDGDEAKEYASSAIQGRLTSIGKCVGQLEEVHHLFFDLLKLRKENITFVKGWFQDTLPQAREEIDQIAILRLDGDWYESTRICLENLYDKVVSGGFIIIDDYGHWEGCQKAVDEFVSARHLRINLVQTDYSEIYFQKQ